MKNLMANTLLALFLALILFVQSMILLQACLIWPAKENTDSDSVFYMGVVIFVTCTTLPFALITGYMVIIV